MLRVQTKHNQLRKSPELKIFGDYESLRGEILRVLVLFIFSLGG